MQTEIARHTPAATFDAAGPSRIADMSVMDAALASAPANTRETAFKVQQVMLAADGARAAGMPVHGYVSQLRDFARQYGATHAFHAVTADAKAACERAAQSIMGAADAYEVLANG